MFKLLRFSVRSTALQIIAFTILICAGGTALFCPFFAPYPPQEQHLGEILSPPGEKYLLGTDEVGRDVLSRILFGTRVSLFVGICAALLAFVGGVTVGSLAGFFEGKVDNICMRLVDVTLACPDLILALALVATVGPSIYSVIGVIAFVATGQFARIARGNVLKEKREDYVLAQKALGASNFSILIKSILPNILSPLITQFTLTVATSILIESALGFLGTGVPPPTPTWGNMLSTGREYLYAGMWWLMFYPGLTIFLLVFSLNVTGETMRDYLDPRTRRTLVRRSKNMKPLLEIKNLER